MVLTDNDGNINPSSQITEENRTKDYKEQSKALAQYAIEADYTYTNGSFIKDNSPFKMTLVATCANGAHGYFPSLIACEHGGYEPDTTKYEHGSAEIPAELYVGMLTELYK